MLSARATIANVNFYLQVKNPDYKANLLKLRNFVMVLFDTDSIVQPKESEWFGFFEPGSDKKMIALEDSQLYKEVIELIRFKHCFIICKD